MDGVGNTAWRPTVRDELRLSYTLPSSDEIFRRMRSVNTDPAWREKYYTIITRKAGVTLDPYGMAHLLMYSIGEAINDGLPANNEPLLILSAPQWIEALVGENKAFIDVAVELHLKLRDHLKTKAGSRFSVTADAPDDYLTYSWTRRAVEMFFEEAGNAPPEMHLSFKPATIVLNSSNAQTTIGIFLLTTTREQTPDKVVSPWGSVDVLEDLGYTGSISPLTTRYLTRLGAVHAWDEDDYTHVWEIRQIDGVTLPPPVLREFGEMVEPEKAGIAWRRMTERYELEKGGK